jgi:hypothetical protein
MKNAGTMSKLRLERLSRESWNSLVGRFSDANFQQSWGYADILASRRNCEHEELSFWEGDELIGLASVRVRRVPILGIGVAYVAGGPLVHRGVDGDLFRFRGCLESLRDEYVVRRKLILRVLAPIGDCRWNLEANTVMSGIGMVPSQSGRAYRTLLLDLDRPLEVIRKDLVQKWRNCLNASEKEGLSVCWTSEPKAFSQFRVNHECFVNSKGFFLDLDATFYESIRNKFDNDAALELALVEIDGTPAASHLGSYLGDTAVYLLGFTEDLALSRKAAYFLHWEVIKRAKSYGMKWYDLGGIDPEENPGVFKFKSGFGGLDVRSAGPMEFSPGIIRSRLLQSMETAKHFSGK